MAWSKCPCLKASQLYLCLVLSLAVVVFLILVAARNDHHRLTWLPGKHATDEDYVQCRTFPNWSNRIDYTTVSLGVTTQRLRGKIVLEQGIKVAQFLSVPYADKPKRFRKPEPPPGWSGQRDALHWPGLCMQNNLPQFEYLTKIMNYSISEDCLYLNIWSAYPDLSLLPNRTNKVRTTSENDLLPVIMFVHGGGFNYMGASFESYYGGVVSALGKVVYVTFNYRVGVFGFFDNQLEQHGELYSKNVGLYDQIAAIEWVKGNIHYFGGNGKLITLQGQSAGAISIGLLMCSPRSSALFERAILQSASPMMVKQMFSGSHYTRLVQLANCSQTEEVLDSKDSIEQVEGAVNTTVPTTNYLTGLPDYEQDPSPKEMIEQRLAETRCLESLPAHTLNRVQEVMMAENTISFSASIPSVLLPDFAGEMLLHQADKLSPKQLLVGGNRNESTLYLHQEFPNEFPLVQDLKPTRGQLVHTIERLLGNLSMTNSFVDGIFNAFARANVTTDREVAAHFLVVLSDFIFKGPVFKFAKSWADHTHSPVYLYQFGEPLPQLYPDWIGPGHWLEMDFVFGKPLLYPHKYTKTQRDFSIRLIQTWAHFARSGEMLPQMGVVWPPLDQRNLHLNLQAVRASLGQRLSMQYYEYFDLMYDAS